MRLLLQSISFGIFVVLLLSSLLSIFLYLISGCKDKNAVNYDPVAFIPNIFSCIYPIKGCLDPKFLNYNRKANVSCQIDCDHCFSDKNKNDILKNKVDCQYCIKKYNYKGIQNCDNGEMCFKSFINFKLPSETSFKETSDMNMFLPKLFMMSSQKQSFVYQGERIILDTKIPGIYGFFFKNKNLKKSEMWKTTQNLKEVSRFLGDLSCDYSNKGIVYTEIIYITNGGVFELFREEQLEQMMRILNGYSNVRTEYKEINETDNMIILIDRSTKPNKIFFNVSNNIIYYPDIEISKMECRRNPTTIFPPKEHLVFSRGDYADDRIKKCALEANIVGKDYFGLTENECVSMDQNQFRNNFRSQVLSSNCYMGVGDFEFMSAYKFKNKYKDGLNKSNGIMLFDNFNFKGNHLVINEGDHNSSNNNFLKKIKSIIIPKDFIVYIFNNDNNMLSIPGEKYLNYYKSDKGLRVNRIIVKKILSNDVLFCSNKEGYGVCAIYGPGKYSFPPYLYKKIKFVRKGSKTKKVTLYSGGTFLNPVKVITDDSYTGIDDPQIIRSVEII